MLESHERNFGEVAPALANRPEISVQNQIYHEAFMVLSSGRQNTDHVLNPIAFGDVMAYCDNIGEFAGYERLRYWAMVNVCDVAWISATVDKRVADAKVETAKAEQANKPRRHR
jgi:hypothetical protein